METDARQHIQQYAKDNGGSYQIIMICGSQFFDALRSHDKVREAYASYPSDAEPLRKRLGGDVINRSWVSEGITYIEDFVGVQMGEIDTGSAYMLPLGIADMFQTHFAPADHKDFANVEAQEMYMFLHEGARHDKVETETSFLMVNTRPELICAIEGSYS